jgi:hypothetical protein
VRGEKLRRSSGAFIGVGGRRRRGGRSYDGGE